MNESAYSYGILVWIDYVTWKAMSFVLFADIKEVGQRTADSFGKPVTVMNIRTNQTIACFMPENK